MLQSKAGYIDARPLTANSAKPLATHGRTIHLGQTRKSLSATVISRFCPEADIAASSHCMEIEAAALPGSVTTS